MKIKRIENIQKIEIEIMIFTCLKMSLNNLEYNMSQLIVTKILSES